MKKYLLLICGVGLLLTSCGIASDPYTNQNQLQTQVVLSQKNYRVVREVEGESEARHYVVGLLGGLSKKALRSSAMNEMIKNANLQGSQAIINAHVQSVNICVVGFLYVKHKAIARGTVIEFTE